MDALLWAVVPVFSADCVLFCIPQLCGNSLRRLGIGCGTNTSFCERPSVLRRLRHLCQTMPSNIPVGLLAPERWFFFWYFAASNLFPLSFVFMPSCSTVNRH